MGKSRRRQITERQLRMIELRASGKSYVEIGDAFGITGSGARVNIHEAARLLTKHGNQAFPDGVSSEYSVDTLVSSVPSLPNSKKNMASTLETDKSLEFVFDEEIQVSEDAEKLEGYVWATDPLVERLKAQEPPLEEDQFMENINFYPVFDVKNYSVSLDGHYYLEDMHYAVGKAFTLPLSDDEAAQLISAFEAYCKKREGVSCLDLINEVRAAQGLKPLRAAVLEYDRALAEKPFIENGFDVLSPQECATMFGKPVRDGDRVYMPAKEPASLDEQIEEASSQRTECVAGVRLQKEKEPSR